MLQTEKYVLQALLITASWLFHFFLVDQYPDTNDLL